MSSYTADRQGHICKNDSGQDRLLEKMYGCAFGRALLKPLVNPALSELGGRILDSRLSALAVPAFIRHAGIDMRDYEKKKFRSYNDFFTRRICEGARPVSMVPEHFVSPCDSRVSVYPIDENCKPVEKYGSIGLFRAHEIPKIDAIVIDKPGLNVACGAIGIGEITSIPTAPAITDAYYRYDGSRRYVLPIDNTPYERKE